MPFPAGGTTDVLGSLHRSVVLGVHSEGGELVGLLVVADDRVRDAFSPEEAQLLGGIAAQVGVVVENSRLYAQMKERDRLAVLGQMAAGLAHEIRNPLGAIKGAAQLLVGPDGKQELGRDRKSTRLNSSHLAVSRMPSSA